MKEKEKAELQASPGGRSTVFGTHGAVACEHPQAALIGIRVLDEGGTAADACVAMAASMAVLAPMMSGMGGDALLLYYEAKSGRVYGMNGAGRAPRQATIQRLREEQGLTEMPQRGGPTITVPGAVRLWADANRRFGVLPFARLLEPARLAAEEGYPVSEIVARHWKGGEDLLRENKAARETFLLQGRAPRPGEIFRQPEMARTLAAISEEGAQAFYEGEIACRIARAAHNAGGLLSEEDLAGHERSALVEPIHILYRGVRVYEMPPPTQGVAALQILNILEGYDLSSLDPLSAERIHLEAEATKLAFQDLHEKVGDPQFVDVPTQTLISKEYAARLRRERISLERTETANQHAQKTDTTYLCAVDTLGNGCSFIGSLYLYFGSGIVADGTGVCLQNRGASFRLEGDHPNALAPSKLPMHTIIPALATTENDDGAALWATFGGVGAPMQPQGQAQVLSNLLDFGMSPQEAVDHPRHRHDDTLLVDGRVPPAEIEKLRRMGHQVELGEDYAFATGGVQLIRVLKNGVRAAASDPRKDGCAMAQ